MFKDLICETAATVCWQTKRNQEEPGERRKLTRLPGELSCNFRLFRILMAETFVILIIHLPAFIPLFLSCYPPIPPPSWLGPEVHLFFGALAQVVRSSCCSSLASGK